MGERLTVRFENADGDELHGFLEKPDGGAMRGIVLFAHCFTCTKNIKAAVNIARRMTREGFAVFRFDFTGLGESEGDFSESNFSSNVADLVTAARHLEAHHGAVEILLGHSLGGAAILQAASSIPSAKLVATIAAPADPAHVTRLFDRDIEQIRKDGEACVTLAGRPFRIRRQLLDDLEAVEWRQQVRELRRPLVIFHSPLDETVEIGNAAELFEEALHPKSFISLDKADHLLSQERDSDFVGRMLAAYARQLLGERDSDELDYDTDIVASNAGPGLVTEVDMGGVKLAADEPVSVAGGSGKGPTPYGLLAAALASCTAMTLRMYARHKDLDVGSIDVSVDHDRIHARDCESCETTDGRIDRFRRRIRLGRDVGAELHDKLLAMADRCPVHRSLENEVSIETEVTIDS
ncbi:MAG: alpha/beta fold hydrolase [Gammaproteobacteria bacterium]|nr:alpha/beta fold hydrolase [Gammaproteobacteria bacterium]